MKSGTSTYRYISTALILLVMAIFAPNATAQNDDRALLIINSYNEAAPWSKDMILPITTLLAKTPGINAEMVSLYGTFIRTEAQMDTLQDRLFARYADNKPDIVVAVGNMSSILVPRIAAEWGDIPIVHITRRLDSGDETHFLTSSYDPGDDYELFPMQRLQEQYNFTAIYVPDYYEETIDLMMQLQPEMKKFVFLADETFLNRMLDNEIRQYIRKKYPHILYTWLIGNKEQGGELHKYILENDLEIGMLISTWYYEHRSIHGYPTMVAGDFYMLPATTTPIFSLRDSYINYGTIGGVYPNPDNTRNAIVRYISSVIDGTAARDIPFYIPDNKITVLDYNQLEESGIDARLLPKDAVIVGAPPSFWEQYKWEVILCLSVLFIIIILCATYFYVERQRIKMLRSFRRLVSNMPIPYAEARVKFDKKDNAQELTYRITNNAYQRLLEDNKIATTDTQPILPDDLDNINIKQLLDNKQVASFVKHFSDTDTYYQLIMCRVPKKQQSIISFGYFLDIFAIDITQRIKTEAELREATKHALESDQLKSAFLANMSHEIRTPLNAIVGFSNLLATTSESEKKEKFINIINTNNTLLLQLINDVLDLAKIESNTLDFEISHINVNNLLHSVSDTISMKIPHGVKFNVVPGPEDCYTVTDPNRVTQVLINLLTNACKFTKKGSITLSYEVDPDHLYFEVRDTGIGIATDDMDKIFNRFNKLNTFSQGNGLGLSIAKTIINKLGGEIGASSRGKGRGTTFWFTLPYDPNAPKPTSAQSTQTREHLPIASGSERPTLVVADDNESNYMLIESLLSPYYNIVHAYDGLEAIELCRKLHPLVVLMDLNMPNMDGYQSAAQIRQFDTRIPIIAVTAYTLSNEKEQLLKNTDFNGYVSKPINKDELISQINKAINIKHNNTTTTTP